MTFHSPEAFLLLIFLPLLLEKEWRKRLLPAGLSRANADAVSFSPPISLSKLPRSLRLQLRAPILSITKVAAFLLLVIALARPQTGTYFAETKSTGRDIMLALDISKSMQGMDFKIDNKRVNRLAALKSVMKDFITRREGDRMGLVVFGTDVFTQCPLTTDQSVLTDFVGRLEIGMAGEQTALGDAIAISLKRMKDLEANSRVIVLVTDGRSTAGALKPKDAAQLAKEAGVSIHTIGIGGKGRVPFPGRDFFGRRGFNYYNIELDDKTLKEIANITGGRYFNAKNTEQLQNVYDEIDKLEEREDRTFEYVEYEEHFFVFAALGTALFFYGRDSS